MASWLPPSHKRILFTVITIYAAGIKIYKLISLPEVATQLFF